MTHEEYYRERSRLLEVLKDAMERGDYHLEMDVKELLSNLSECFYKEDNMT